MSPWTGAARLTTTQGDAHRPRSQGHHAATFRTARRAGRGPCRRGRRIPAEPSRGRRAGTRRRAAGPRGAGRAATGVRAVHRAGGHHRGRVPPAAAGARGPRRRVDRGHPRGRRELRPRARRTGGDGRLGRARRGHPATAAPRHRHLPRQGQGAGAARHRHRRRRRHRRLRRRADPGSAARPRGRRQGEGHRPHRPDPRHLRPARQEPGGQGAGRAGPAPVPPAAPAWLGRVDVPPGRWTGGRRSGHGVARSR